MQFPYPKLNNNSLHICHVNAGSIFANIDQFRRIFENSGAHVIAASETWLKSYRSNVSVSLSGYDLLRNDRVGKRSGGVALYIKKDIKTKVIKASSKLKSEYLFVELIFPNYKILVAAYYKAPDVDEINEFSDVVAEMIQNYADVILLGDFNENLLRNMSGTCTKCARQSCRTCRFSVVLNNFALTSLGSEPTNFDQTPSLIDLIITTNQAGFNRFGQLSSTLSNHDIL